MPTLSYLTLFLLTIVVYFMWMDVALYINLQQVPPNQPGVVPLRTNTTAADHYSPFYPITMKLIFQGPSLHYIDIPLSYWTVTYTNVAHAVSANAISVAGVFVAALATRLMVSDALRMRQLGVVLFKVRDYLDSLDGFVARVRRNQKAMMIEAGSFGYYFDGVCDALGDLFLFLAIGIFVWKTWYCSSGGASDNGYAYSKLELPVKASDIRNKTFVRKLIPVAVLVGCVALQTVLSSVLWNLTMITYSQIFESTAYASTAEQMLVQNDLLKSSAMWMVVYFWRLLGPHSLTQLLLVAMLYNRLIDYLKSIQFVGYTPILATGLFTHLYAKYAISCLAATASTAVATMA